MTTTRTTELLRGLFVIFTTFVGALVGKELVDSSIIGGMIGMIFGLTIVLVDRLLRGVSLRIFSSATVGLLLGLLMARLLKSSEVLRYLPDSMEWLISLITYIIFGYFGMMLAMRSSRDEFSLLIPYVRFTRQSVQDAPIIIDTNIIIDGRIATICKTGFVSSSLIIPSFVIDELHTMADSSSPLKRDKGRRGLDILQEMQDSPLLDVSIHDTERNPSLSVDSRLIELATLTRARLLSNDTNLCRVARLQRVTALNLTELTQALHPRLSAGDEVSIALIKQGREDHQAVGYLMDGTMIVVNHAQPHIGQEVVVTIAGSLKTTAGQLFFAELVTPSRPNDQVI